MNVEQETLGFRRGSLSLPLSLLMSAFALLIPPASLSRHLRRPTERSPTISMLLLEHAHGCRFALCRATPKEGKTTNLQLRRGGFTLSQQLFLFVCRFASPCWSSISNAPRNLNALKGALISAASVHSLAPLHLPRRTTRSVSYYAFFK